MWIIKIFKHWLFLCRGGKGDNSKSLCENSALVYDSHHIILFSAPHP